MFELRWMKLVEFLDFTLIQFSQSVFCKKFKEKCSNEEIELYLHHDWKASSSLASNNARLY